MTTRKDAIDAHKYRLAQAEKILALFAAANGHWAKTHEELEAWAISP